MISRTKEMIPLPSSFSPGPGDVICSKGKLAKSHSANLTLRKLIRSSLPEYSECPSKLERSFIVSRIMKTIRDASPDGGFVRNVDGVWYEVGDRNAREKIGQHFRDLLHTKYRSSTKAKASIRKQRASNPKDKDSSSSISSDSQTSSEASASAVAQFCPSDFPISEVSISMGLPQTTPNSKPELGLKDLEPLPLSQGVEFNLSSSSFESDSDESFDSVMQDLYKQQFSAVPNRRMPLSVAIPSAIKSNTFYYEMGFNGQPALTTSLGDCLELNMHRYPSN